MNLQRFSKLFTVALGSASYFILFAMYIKSFQPVIDCGDYLVGYDLCMKLTADNLHVIQFQSGIYGLPVFLGAALLVFAGTVLVLRDIYKASGDWEDG